MGDTGPNPGSYPNRCLICINGLGQHDIPTTPHRLAVKMKSCMRKKHLANFLGLLVSSKVLSTPNSRQKFFRGYVLLPPIPDLRGQHIILHITGQHHVTCVACIYWLLLYGRLCARDSRNISSFNPCNHPVRLTLLLTSIRAVRCLRSEALESD